MLCLCQTPPKEEKDEQIKVRKTTSAKTGKIRSNYTLRRGGLQPTKLKLAEQTTKTERYAKHGLMDVDNSFRRSAYKSLSSHEPPFPMTQVSQLPSHWADKSSHTILKVFNSSLICWASIGVRRLQVAISPRRSYSWLAHVS